MVASQAMKLTPEPKRRAAWLCYDRLTLNPVDGGIINDDGWTFAPVAPDEPGIGAQPDEAVLGDPVSSCSPQTVSKHSRAQPDEAILGDPLSSCSPGTVSKHSRTQPDEAVLGDPGAVYRLGG